MKYFKKFRKRYPFNMLFGVLILAISGCGQPGKNNASSSSDTLVNDSITNSVLLKKKFGDRYSIVGDFNGDNISDTVFESYISSLTNSETYKTADSTDWENNIDLIIKNKPVTRLYTTIKGVDTFIVTKEPQQSGLFHYRNLGDVNGDGKDEIGYAIHWTDNSNLNTYHIMELQNNTFAELFSFQINESLLYDGQEGLFENSELIKQKNSKTILYKYQSDSATIEVGEHTFKMK